MAQAMKARLALLISSAAAGGQKLQKINAWKSWAAASSMDVCDLLAWSLEHLRGRPGAPTGDCRRSERESASASKLAPRWRRRGQRLEACNLRSPVVCYSPYSRWAPGPQ